MTFQDGLIDVRMQAEIIRVDDQTPRRCHSRNYHGNSGDNRSRVRP